MPKITLVTQPTDVSAFAQLVAQFNANLAAVQAEGAQIEAALVSGFKTLTPAQVQEELGASLQTVQATLTAVKAL